MKNYLACLCDPCQQMNPLFCMLGMRLLEAEQGRAKLSLPLLPSFRQGGGVVAGGILATIADEAMAHAAMSKTLKQVVTIEMNVRYLRSVAPSGEGELIAEAEVVKAGRSIIVAEAKVYDNTGRLLVISGGSFAVLEKKQPA